MKKILVLLLWVSLSLFVYAEEQRNHETRIIGGTHVSEDDDTWRFIVALKDSTGQFCAGSLISRKWVLTAAHCLTGNSPEDVTIGVGNYDKTKTKSYTASRFIVHENYDSFTTDNDIGLIELSKPVRNNNTISYDKSSDITPAGTASKVAGWGTIKTDYYLDSDILIEVLAPIVDKDVCNSTQGYAGEVTDNMLCAGYISGGKDSCQGDSGGPLIVENTLIGIVSWGEECAKEDYPGVYTNVKKYATWIANNIAETTEEENNLIYATAPLNPRTRGSMETNADESVTMTAPTDYSYLYVRTSETGYKGALSRDLVAGETLTVKVRAKSSSINSYIRSYYLNIPKTNFSQVDTYEDFVFTVTVRANVTNKAWLGLFTTATGESITVQSVEILDRKIPTPNTWHNTSIPTQNTATVATFTARPTENNLDTVIGFSNIEASTYSDLGIIVRFASNGKIDVRNGGGYAADTSIEYYANIEYLFRVEIDFSQHTYSVYVSPEDDIEELIAKDYHFRDEKSTMSEINYMAYYSINSATVVDDVNF